MTWERDINSNLRDAGEHALVHHEKECGDASAADGGLVEDTLETEVLCEIRLGFPGMNRKAVVNVLRVPMKGLASSAKANE